MSQTGTSPDPMAPTPWEPPTADQEWEVTTIAEAPDWVDKGWAGFDKGPAIAVPMGDLYGTGPYHTQFAHIGDTLKFVAPVGSTPGHFVIIPKEPDPETMGTKKPPQQSAASLEDMLKNGILAPDDLGEDAKGEVAGRSPGLKRMVEEGLGAPEPQAVSDIVKTA